MLQKDKDYFIRYMTKEDVKKVAHLDKSIFSHAWSEEAYFDELKNEMAVTLVADLSGEIVGYINVRKVYDEVYINNIAVHEKYRKNHIGTELLIELEEKVKGTVAFITLEVREGNIAAQKLYNDCGYKKAGMRKNFYEKPAENAVLMTKEI